MSSSRRSDAQPIDVRDALHDLAGEIDPRTKPPMFIISAHGECLSPEWDDEDRIHFTITIDRTDRSMA